MPDNEENEKSVDISLDMKQVAIAAFATGLIIGVIITGSIFVLTNVSEDINQDENPEDVSLEPANLEVSQHNYEFNQDGITEGGNFNLDLISSTRSFA